jgi:hypothetical protein
MKIISVSSQSLSEVLEFLKSIVNQVAWKPTVIICNFEKALWNGILQVFPSIQIWGCYFHLQQALQRWLKKEKMMRFWKIVHQSLETLAKKCIQILFL